MSALERLTVGIIVERRKIDNPWQKFRWEPVDVVPGITVEPGAEWKLLREENDWAHFLVGSKDIELFRSETEGHRLNLSNNISRVFVVLPLTKKQKIMSFIPFLVAVFNIRLHVICTVGKIL